MERLNLVGKKGAITLIVAVLVAGAAGFWAGYDFKANEIRNALSQALEDPDDSIAQKVEAEPLEGQDVIEVKPGETMSFATIDVEFISAESKDMINVPFGTPFVADEGTKFVVVRHKVTNTTKVEFTYDVLPILDDNDRLYNRDIDVYGFDDNLAHATLMPGVAKTGVTVYRVPADTTSFMLGGTKGGTDQFIGTKFTVE